MKTKKTTSKAHDSWTVIQAFDCITSTTSSLGYCQEFLVQCFEPLDYLTKRLSLSVDACIILSELLEHEEAITWTVIAKDLKCSRIKSMLLNSGMEELIKSRWVYSSTCSRGRVNPFISYRLAPGVFDALRRNETFIPDNIHCDTTSQLLESINSYYEDTKNSFEELDYENFESLIIPLLRENMHLPFSKFALSCSDVPSTILLSFMASDYVRYADTPNEGIFYSDVCESFPEDYYTSFIRRNLLKLTHPLITDGWITPDCANGIVDTTRFLFTRKAKDELLENYVSPRIGAKSTLRDEESLLRADSIKPKTLFYHPDDLSQVNTLMDLLKPERFSQIQSRLTAQGLPLGFGCLFYGSPGTGKTETVLQIARLTERDIIQVDISKIRDKFVGESEKNIKDVFKKYRRACDNSVNKPILLFNEADAIFGNRLQSVEHSVDQMNNSIQNIILQEMETLDGILIATTNLAGNLDPAFERRFLYKIQFHKPDAKAMTEIWRTQLPELKAKDAAALAAEFNLSGAQIENIVRRNLVNNLLTGKKTTLDSIRQLCKTEILNLNHRPAIGF